ncbi:MAG: hypothetical protein DWQ31_17955 [Planctomycetota bacterium]|nr:MAG: hypothetical protein DWQ31_17955 [Planctomycetota bacterium]REJ92368.1 MAG: hypothetical protein DWQ35_12380 [Planctomycetota bacterium]
MTMHVALPHPDRNTNNGRRPRMAAGVGLAMFVFAAWASAANLAEAQSWPRFRGPNGAGQSDATTIPVKWSEADYNWVVDLEGSGHSSPVVWGDRLVITTGDTQTATRRISCRSTLDGKELWGKSFKTQPHRLHRKNSYASSTPALDGQRAYFTWATPAEYVVVALDLDTGAEAWRVDLGGYQSAHGYGSSPIVYDDMVIVTKDHNGSSFLLALDRRTGDEVWKSPRGGGGKAAYSVPCIYTAPSGETAVICHSTEHGISGLNPRNGDVLWSASDVFVKRCVNSPVVAAGLVFGTAGQGGNGDAVVAVRPGSEGRSAEVAYEVRKSAPYVITPVAYQDMLFVWHDAGVVTCLDPADGKVHWRERVGGAYSGSPVRVGEFIYCISESGTVVVLKAAKEFELVAENELGERSYATPAIADGRMYLRTETRLFSLGGE